MKATDVATCRELLRDVQAQARRLWDAATEADECWQRRKRRPGTTSFSGQSGSGSRAHDASSSEVDWWLSDMITK